MTRQQFEHIIRAAAGTAAVRDVVVIGSQAILGSYPDPPSELTESLKADRFSRDDAQRSIVIDGAIGELSLFHETFGYYAHGVDETTATLPEGWRERLVKVQTENTMGAVGWCLEPHDLAVSKLVAGRPKDVRFVETMLQTKLVSPDTVRERLACTISISPQARQIALATLEHCLHE
jgi:hypothetical protein